MWFKRELLISCGEARERMLNAPLIKWHIKNINKLIRKYAKNGYESVVYRMYESDRMVLDDVQNALVEKGYKVTVDIVRGECYQGDPDTFYRERIIAWAYYSRD